MVSLGTNTKESGITWLDITLVVTLTALWFFFSQVWTDRLSGIMFSLSGILLAIYLIGRYSGALAFMTLSIPTWTISGLISIPIWLVYLTFIPAASSTLSSTSEAIGESVIGSLLGQDFVVRFLQIFLFPATESLFIIFLLAFFIGVARKRLGATNKQAEVVPLIVVASFGALMHTSVAKKFEQVVSFSASLLQQFVSFAIMLAFGLFLFAPAIITSHITKNLLILGNGAWFFATFGFFILIDLAILIMFKNRKDRVTNTTKFS